MFEALNHSLYARAAFKPDRPDRPDPYRTAEDQFNLNSRTAREQQRLGMTNQDTTRGSLRYVADSNSPSGYRAVSSLTAGQQGLFDQSERLQGQIGDVLSDQVGRVGQLGAFDLNAARGTEISDIQRTFLDPQWNERRAAFDSDLTNRGIRQGSQAYETATRDFEGQRASAYDRMFLDSYKTANDAALTERNLPLSDIASFRGTQAPQVGEPQFGNTPQPGVAPVDLMGSVNNQYAQDMQGYNAALGGLYGIGGAALGGWASRGFPTPRF